ncbi:formyl-CoA transferase [Caballeronia calidae]|uniref:Formyl-CoA transferase n=1 Tax=Caballeronia calidae TaxID=1777139 RepID=A0A158E4L1_9BURK|nr:CoA transferase [Caballeronia calidae]SAL01789.1 formyl-CoA transferase [Caballeronia calidae]
MSSLNGMRVLDLTQYLSGPYCTMLLGDFGADVVKVEKLQGDDQRRLSPFVNDESAPFMAINRNKRSITLNLKSEQGKSILFELVQKSDVLVENFRPGIAKSLGIDYEAVRQVNPGIIYCSISGYGQTGPCRTKGGFDILAQGMTGLMDVNSPSGDRPVKIPVSFHDIGASLTALYSILCAYIHKLQGGAGQYLDISLVDSGLSLVPVEAAAYFVNGVVPKVAGTQNLLAAPYQAYKTRDGYVVVGASNQKLWEKFCKQVVDRPTWIEDTRFATVSDRVAHIDELERIIELVLTHEDTGYWVEKLDAAGIPGGPINTFDQALRDPQVIARDMIVELEHPRAGKIKNLASAAKMSGTPAQIRMPAPTVGQHTVDILSEMGLTTSEVEALKRDKVV